MRATTSVGDPVDAIRRERDLYRRLLHIGRHTDPDALLREALAVAVESVGAAKGYLAIYQPDHQPGDPPRWSTTHGTTSDESASIADELSRTIIDDTLETRRVALIPSAMGHPRYAAADSVRLNRITSVVCAPIGNDGHGVLYLQDRALGGVFSDADEEWIVALGKHLGPFVDRLLLRAGDAAVDDPTAPARRGGRFRGLVGRSDAAAQMLEHAAAVAPVDSAVVVCGRPGSGRTTLARQIHAVGRRREGPLVEVHGGELPDDEARAELFGDVADPSRHALVEVARGGTLLIEDVQQLPDAVQGPLAVLLDRGTYRPVGGGEPQRADVRVICTCACDLGDAVEDGRLREDLQRLLLAHVVEVPSLADRPDDVRLLAEHFGRQISTEQRVPWHGFTDEAVAKLEGAAWPGELRELLHAVERAVVAAGGARAIGAGDLHVSSTDDSATRSGGFEIGIGDDLLPFREARNAFTRAYLQSALERHEGNVTATANALGLSRSRMYALLQELEL